MSGPADSSLAAQIALELSRLRKGPGIYSPEISQHLGPRLRELVEATGSAQEPLLRTELALLLDRAATRVLSPQQREVALFGLGVHRSHGDRRLIARETHVAGKLKVSVRTVQRRMDQAFTALAGFLADELEQARSASDVVLPGWRVETLDTELTFDGRRPTVVERRTILSLTENLTAVTTNLSLPRGPGSAGEPLQVSALSGCRVGNIEEQYPGFWSVTLALPAPVPLGATHAYSAVFDAPPGATMLPVYGFGPLRPARQFTATVTFSDPDEVDGVWELPGVPQATALSSTVPLGPPVPFEADGRTVRCSYTGLVQGLAYGVQWRWSGRDQDGAP